MEKISSLPFHPIQDGHCDVVVEKPTFFMKLDAGLYYSHNFCFSFAGAVCC